MNRDREDRSWLKASTWFLFQGYEYFGYDTSTYYNTDHEHGDQDNCSYIIEDGQAMAADDDSGTCHGDRAEKPLEIDLDRVPNEEKKEAASVCKSVRDGTDPKQILCKWVSGKHFKK